VFFKISYLKQAPKIFRFLPDWGSDVRILLANGYKMPRKGTDAGDHPPITPMRYATKEELVRFSYFPHQKATHFIQNRTIE
jgi:hypothetical protein